MHPAATQTRRTAAWLQGYLVRSLLTATALGAVASAAIFTTHATFTDQTTMAQVQVIGGTLDLKANGGDGPNQAWAGTLSAVVSNMAPGDTQQGAMQVTNSGNLPFTLRATSTGTDAGGCFGYWLRETAATGATKDASFPTNVASFGTNATTDGATAPFAATVTNQPIYDVSATDLIWETDDVKTFTLTVRMKSSCTTNGANGALSFALDATQ
ncbi:MAG: hypothetical protein H7287_14470 [Thermoleophilia bacterium]|nr:hypothetical protein [Thermoleophilia bacterium]